MASKPPLQGYNHNIPYKNRIYHVQTEDSGVERPVISTHLFHEGMILNSARFEYHELLDESNWQFRVRRRMKDQHKRLMKELIHGKMDDQIVESLGELDPEAEPDTAEPRVEVPVVEAPVELAEVAAAPAPAEQEPQEEPEEFIPGELADTLQEPAPDESEEFFPAAEEPAPDEPMEFSPDEDQSERESTSEFIAAPPAKEPHAPAEVGVGIPEEPVQEAPVEFIRPPTAEEPSQVVSLEAMGDMPEEEWVDAPSEFIPPASVEVLTEQETEPSGLDDHSGAVVEDMEPVQHMMSDQAPAATDALFSMESLATPDFDSPTLVDAPSPSESEKPRFADRSKFQHAVTGELDVGTGENAEAGPQAADSLVEVDASLPSIRYAETAELPLQQMLESRDGSSLRSAETAELPIRGEGGDLVPDMDEMIARFRSGEYAPSDTHAMPEVEQEGEDWEVDDTEPGAVEAAPPGMESMDEPVFEFVFGDEEASAEYRAVPSPPPKPEIAPREPSRPSLPVNPLRPTGTMQRRAVPPARPTRSRASVPPVSREPEQVPRSRARTQPPAMSLRPPAPLPKPEPQPKQKFKTKPSGVFPLVAGTARRFTPVASEPVRETGPLRRRPSSLLRYTAPTRSHSSVDTGQHRDPRITQNIGSGLSKGVTGPHPPSRARSGRITTQPLVPGRKGLQTSSSVTVSKPIIVGRPPAKPREQTQAVGSVPPAVVPGRYSYVKEHEQAGHQAGQENQQPEDRGLDEVILAYLEENE